MKEEGCRARVPPSQLPRLSPLVFAYFMSVFLWDGANTAKKAREGAGNRESYSVALHPLPLSPSDSISTSLAPRPHPAFLYGCWRFELRF